MNESTKQIPPPLPEAILKWRKHSGEYAIDELKVYVTSDTHSLIECERYMVNSPKYQWHVTLYFWERWAGLTLQQKVARRKEEIRRKLERENQMIADRRQTEQRLNSV